MEPAVGIVLPGWPCCTAPLSPTPEVDSTMPLAEEHTKTSALHTDEREVHWWRLLGIAPMQAV